MLKGIVLEKVSKIELLSEIREAIGDDLHVLMTPAEAAALLGVANTTISNYKATGVLKDYSTNNEYRKFSAKDVLKLRR